MWRPATAGRHINRRLHLANRHRDAACEQSKRDLLELAGKKEVAMMIPSPWPLRYRTRCGCQNLIECRCPVVEARRRKDQSERYTYDRGDARRDTEILVTYG